MASKKKLNKKGKRITKKKLSKKSKRATKKKLSKKIAKKKMNKKAKKKTTKKKLSKKTAKKKLSKKAKKKTTKKKLTKKSKKKSKGKAKKKMTKHLNVKLTKFKKVANQQYLNAKLKRTGYKDKLKKSLISLKEILKQESKETKLMFETYTRYSLGEATKKEMEEANTQFRDLLKGVGLGVIVVLPFSPITIPVIAKLGQRLGVDVFPTAVKEQLSKDKN